MKMKALTVFGILTVSQLAVAQNIEDFNDVTNLPGWLQINNSSPLGTTNWIQGNDTVFPAQSGAITSFIAANFNNTTGGAGVTCNFLVIPDVDVARLTFWSRTTIAQDGFSVYPDRLRVRYSANDGVNTGDCTNDFGDFAEELLVINPTLSTSDYPAGYPFSNWQEFTVAVPGPGRVAFVYNVTNAGPEGNNSNYIGIDSVNWVESSDMIYWDGFE